MSSRPEAQEPASQKLSTLKATGAGIRDLKGLEKYGNLEALDESHIESAGLLRYFELRQAWNRREYEKVGSEELVFLNQARNRRVKILPAIHVTMLPSDTP
ncbi:MAG TPA: hypothetical protein VFS12_18465 [Terriglobia bacterium]|nr:hypothetical protein [Terriglobia bacterium]